VETIMKIILATAMCLFGVVASIEQTPASLPAQAAPDELATLSPQWMEAARHTILKLLSA
jgi:hypothetical protein